jgi:hypothetical protein
MPWSFELSAPRLADPRYANVRWDSDEAATLLYRDSELRENLAIVGWVAGSAAILLIIAFLAGYFRSDPGVSKGPAKSPTPAIVVLIRIAASSTMTFAEIVA